MFYLKAKWAFAIFLNPNPSPGIAPPSGWRHIVQGRDPEHSGEAEETE